MQINKKTVFNMTTKGNTNTPSAYCVEDSDVNDASDTNHNRTNADEQVVASRVRSKGFISFKKAKKCIRKKNLKNKQEWIKHCSNSNDKAR